MKKSHANQKFSDEDLLRLNSVGLSLGTIAKALNCHPSAITHRFKSLGIKPMDTRHAFMETIFLSLDLQQQEWLANKMGGSTSALKQYLTQLIVSDFKKENP